MTKMLASTGLPSGTHRLLAGAALCAALLLPASRGVAQPDPGRSNLGSPSSLCEDAIRTAERQYRLPPGLLYAIGLAESARADPITHRARPWPWSVQSGGTSIYFETKAEAVRWVRDAQAHGVTSIDTGCLQVNLFFHPQAFETVDVAFDPPRNVDYAARFLLQLYAETHDWGQATGFYHSHTPELAGPYQQRVQQAMSAPLPPGAAVRPITVAGQLGLAWRATLGPAEPAQLASAGNGWDTLLRDQSPPASLKAARRPQQVARQPAAGPQPRPVRWAVEPRQQMVSELRFGIQTLAR